MLSVASAQERILANVKPNEAATYAVDEASGLVVAEPPVASVDMPPFDKAAVDGYAVKACDAAAGRSFAVGEEVMAGSTPSTKVTPGRAVKIMTGAPVPASADTVIMLESTRSVAGRIEVTRDTPPGRNICRRGEDMQAGQPLLSAGTVVVPQHAGLLAGQGCTTLRCHRRPTVAILATGDEVVGPEATPAPGQIRNANNTALGALIREGHGRVIDLGIAPDEPEALRAAIARGLEADVLLASGGVSAGTLDLVPEAAGACGVEEVFHHIAIQPGRPVLYGRSENGHFFGLPGNPVAAVVCYKVLVEPLIRTVMGYEHPLPPLFPAAFEGTFKRTDERMRLVGVELLETDNGRQARKVPTHGPADLQALARSTGLAVLPPGTGPYRGGERVEVMKF